MRCGRLRCLPSLFGIGYADQPIPDLVIDGILWRVGVVWSSHHLAGHLEFGVLAEQVNVDRPVLEPCPLRHDRDRLQFSVAERLEAVVDVLQVEGGRDGFGTYGINGLTGDVAAGELLLPEIVGEFILLLLVQGSILLSAFNSRLQHRHAVGSRRDLHFEQMKGGAVREHLLQ